jgi:2-phosphosulfolactate phosphatase
MQRSWATVARVTPRYRRDVERTLNPASQHGFDRRFDWGLAGSTQLAQVDVLVIVDVLSFSTAVDVAVARDATVIPARWRDARARELADELGAVLAVGRSAMSPTQPYSLSPASLTRISRGTRLVLPSPNGATICAEAASAGATVFAGCLRNADAVAQASAAAGAIVGVVAAGEEWPDGSLRPALEDLAGAGAILAALGGSPSPEARPAIAVHSETTTAQLADCISARELIALGYEQDVEIATSLNASTVAPVLRDLAFRNGGIS